MLQSHKFWVVLVCAATLLTAFIFLFNINGTREKALQLLKPDLIEENGQLKNENAYIKSELDGLNKLNRSLRKYLDLYEINFIELKDAVKDCYPIKSMNKLWGQIFAFDSLLICSRSRLNCFFNLRSLSVRNISSR